MSDWRNPLFLVNVLTGIVFIITAIITLRYPPKKINSFYGYRTKSSMKSQEIWDFAQEYSSRLLYKYGIVLLVLGVLGYFTSFGEVTGVIICLFTMTLLVILLVYKTEKEIKQRF